MAKSWSRKRRGRLGAWLWALLLATALTGAALAEKKIALTFNDLPSRGPSGFWRPREVSNQILRTLEEHQVAAAGFVVQEKIDDQPMLYVVLTDWAERGFILGNQSYSRVDYNVLDYRDYYEHVKDGQKDIARLGRLKGIAFRFFRPPQLHYGNTEGKLKDLRGLLRRNGYQMAHVTVKTSDHQFIRAYLEHEREPENVARLQRLFLAHVNQSLEYAEQQSEKVFGRNIRHILLLRCGIATAMFLDELITFLKEEKGYSFVTLSEALEDTAYQAEDEYAGPEGLIFIDRVAATRGLTYNPQEGELQRDDVERWLQEMIAEESASSSKDPR
ncbi:MAG TPA: polysaccharide deacetylase family protein [Acidobacteriota bacterium]|nr:polysaccharide deacetylase family protein [Acidobacteriota bacterium]